MSDGPTAEFGSSSPLLRLKGVKPSPDTLTSKHYFLKVGIQKTQSQLTIELVKRLRALTLQLLPVQVQPSEINEVTSRIITREVILAYKRAAGDFEETV